MSKTVGQFQNVLQIILERIVYKSSKMTNIIAQRELLGMKQKGKSLAKGEQQFTLNLFDTFSIGILTGIKTSDSHWAIMFVAFGDDRIIYLNKTRRPAIS